MAIREMTKMVIDWIAPKIPDKERDPMNTCIKMTEEVSELMHAIHCGGDVGEECADVLILLLDIAHLNGVDLEEEFSWKMHKNHTRTWNKRNGSLKHEAD